MHPFDERNFVASMKDRMVIFSPSNLTEELPKFSWEDVSIIQLVGIGAFGSVELANFRAATDTNPCQKVVIKQPLENLGRTREFLKEAQLLHSVKGHRNIIEFISVCGKPRYGIMQEYVSFSFAMFDDDTNVSSLGEFLSHVDETYDFVGFEKIQITIANV